MAQTWDSFDVAIVGGGIAGLSVAYRLICDAPWLRVALFEATDRIGGKVLTERVETEHGSFIVEAGPDAYLAQKPWARDLAIELGLGDEIIPINRSAFPVQLMKQGTLHDLPDGIRLIAPTKAIPFARSTLLGPLEKLRAAGDLVKPSHSGSPDESLSSFVRRRLGTGVLDWIAEPLVTGIYNADPQHLSVAATFPQFLELEARHRSVIRGLRANRVQTGKPAPPLFESFRVGTATLVDALARRTQHISRTACRVSGLSRTAAGMYSVEFLDGNPVTAKWVVLAAPAEAAARIIRGTAPDASRQLSTLRTETAGTISMAFRKNEIHRPMKGYGLVIPAREGAEFNAMTIASEKFPGRAPESWTLLRLFFGGYRSPSTIILDEPDLIKSAISLLSKVMGIDAKPLFTRVTRWPAGSPQYDVGHLDRIKSVRASLPPNVSIIGSPYDGVGLPDITRSATDCAKQLVASSQISHCSPF